LALVAGDSQILYIARCHGVRRFDDTFGDCLGLHLTTVVPFTAIA